MSAFTAEQIAYLEDLDAVAEIRSGRFIRYSDRFVRDASARYAQGESPVGIFEAAGIPAAIAGEKRIEKFFSRICDRDPAVMVERKRVLEDAGGGLVYRKRLMHLAATSPIAPDEGQRVDLARRALEALGVRPGDLVGGGA